MQTAHHGTSPPHNHMNQFFIIKKLFEIISTGSVLRRTLANISAQISVSCDLLQCNKPFTKVGSLKTQQFIVFIVFQWSDAALGDSSASGICCGWKVQMLFHLPVWCLSWGGCQTWDWSDLSLPGFPAQPAQALLQRGLRQSDFYPGLSSGRKAEAAGPLKVLA